MGNNRFNALLTKYKQYTHKSVKLSKYWGKKIAVDGTNILHVTFSNAHKSCVRKGELLVDPERRFKKWVEIFLQFVGELLDGCILPIFIFDGIPPEYKNKTREDRRKKRQEAAAKLDKMRKKILAGDESKVEEYYKKYRGGWEYLPAAGYEFFPRLLASLGIPAIIAKHEAEPLCVYLQRKKHVDAVLSNDIDNIAYGCTDLIMHKQKDKLWLATGVKSICNALGITYEQMLKVYILCGCDYNSGIVGKKQGGIKIYNLYKDAGRKIIKELEKEHDLKYEFCYNQFSSLKINSLIRDGLFEQQLCYNSNCFPNVDAILTELDNDRAAQNFKIALENFIESLTGNDIMFSDTFLPKRYDLKSYFKAVGKKSDGAKPEPASETLDEFI